LTSANWLPDFVAYIDWLVNTPDAGTVERA
jgi:hypothetical protein